MKYSQKIKPITYLKNHTAEVVKEVTETSSPIIITHNGEARIVIQDIRNYEQQRETLTLLKMLAQSSESLKKGKFRPLKQSFEIVRKRVEEAK